MFAQVLDSIAIIAVVAIFVVALRLYGWMAVLAPRAYWRGWADENKGKNGNPYKAGTIDAKAYTAGWDASKETDPHDHA